MHRKDCTPSNEIINIPDSNAVITVTAFAFSCLRSLKLYVGFFCGKEAVQFQLLLQEKILDYSITADISYPLK